MDVLIKDLKMPKGRAIFVVLRPNGAYCYGHVPECFSYHPVVEVKPHGRLIDADALPIKDEWSLVGTDVIWDAPTVLEANG